MGNPTVSKALVFLAILIGTPLTYQVLTAPSRARLLLFVAFVIMVGVGALIWASIKDDPGQDL